MTMTTFIKINRRFADPGATPEMIEATETTIEAISGLDKRLALSALLNVVAMIIASTETSEVKAREEAARFGQMVRRCIEVN